MADNFTQEELDIAKSVDLISVASSLGYTPKRIGKYYTLKEMDSIRIYPNNHWCRFSQRYEKGNNGGSQIDFIRIFENLSVVDSVLWLLNYAGYSRDTQNFKSDTYKQQYKQRQEMPKEEKRVEFILPPKSPPSDKMYNYLSKKRGLSYKVCEYFYKRNLIYESLPYHNIVFKSLDANGVCRHAHQRGTIETGGKGFKGDVPGNDKNYGFNIVNLSSDKLNVFEGAINMMSYMDMFDNYEDNFLALGMTGDNPLVRFLEEHTHIKKLNFALDNDKAGIKATEIYIEKYKSAGYEVTTEAPELAYNDYNDWLKDIVTLDKCKKR